MGKRRCYGCMKLTAEPDICEHCGHDRRSSNRSHALPAGTVLHGQYLVGRVLGQGGFGITYLGWDKVLDTPVAIKEYYPSGTVFRDCAHTNELSVLGEQMMIQFLENRDRFLREARILGKLEGVDEVVKIRNFFVENNTAYIIMGYVQGITLMEHVSRSGGKLSVEETLRLITPLLKGMEQVHAVGLVHRDISPDNIMLQSSGKVTIIDFGSAHPTVSGNKSTQTTLKHGFAPPEQYQRRGNLGSWTDVYAMCATIYYCLTGTFPPNVTDRMMGGEDFRWDIIPDLTPGQQQTLRQGLALSIEDRTKTMLELHNGLFLELTPAKASAPPPRKNAPPVNLVPPVPDIPVKAASAPPSRKRPLVYIAILAAILLIVLAAILLLLPSSEFSPFSDIRSGSYDIASSPSEADPVDSISSAASGSRILMRHSSDFTNGNGQITEDNWYAFGTNILRKDIYSVTVLNTLRDAPRDAVDASLNRDGSVLCWTEPNGSLYDLYLGAEGGVIAPGYCNEMFYGFRNLQEVDLRHLDTRSVMSMAWMFCGCSSLQSLDLSYLNNSSVTTTAFMFSDCNNLKELTLFPLNSPTLTDIAGMFRYTYSLSNVSAEYDFSNVEIYDEFMDRTDTFNDQPWKKVFPSTAGTSRILLNVPIDQTETRSPDYYAPENSYSFDGTRLRHEIASITFLDSVAEAPLDAVDASLEGDDSVLAWSIPNGSLYDLYIAAEGGVIAPADCSYLFSHYINLRSIDLAALDTGSVTSMEYMFTNCEKLTDIDLSSFNTGNVTSMNSMFFQCHSLKKVDLSSFDTSIVTSIAFMFYQCEALAELDISSFGTGNLTNITFFAADTPNLTSITCDFDVSGVTEYTSFMDNDDLINGRPWQEYFR